MKKKNIIPLCVMALLLFCGFIGSTIAYYTSSDTYENDFNTATYHMNTLETFVSPNNWKPGDTTQKEVSVKNKGDISAAVKVCFRQEWEDTNGDPLPLKDANDNPSVIFNFDSNYSTYWLRDCDNTKYCFYYYKEVVPTETTRKLLESVTFNPNFNVKAANTCTENPTTHVKTCTSSVTGYNEAKYTLYVDIETVQYNQYQNIWTNAQVQGTTQCENLTIAPNS